jgi:hypothetical protein
VVKFDRDLMLNETRKGLIDKTTASVHVDVGSVFVLSEDPIKQQQGFRHVP